MAPRLVHLAISFAALVCPLAAAQTALFTVASTDGNLRRIDPATGATLAATPLQLLGMSVTNAQGLAVDPTTGVMYAILSINNQPGRRLAIVDPATGLGTDVGDLLDKFSALMFDSSGQLYAVSGDGAAVPETLYLVNKANAAKSLLLPLGHGSMGETLCFEPKQGLIYHASGIGTLNDPAMGTILETIDPATLAVTPVTLSGPSITGIQAFTRLDEQTFVALDQGGRLFLLQTTGAFTQIGQADHTPKGMVFLPGPSFFEPYGGGCAGSGGFVPSLAGQGSPNPGSTVSISIGSGFGGGAGLLLFGAGQGTLPVVPSCSLQIAPLLPDVFLALVLNGAGAGAGSLAFPAVIPSDLPAVDVEIQAVFADPAANGHVAASNALHVHIQ